MIDVVQAVKIQAVLTAWIKHPNEAALIGRILASYGELELELCGCVAWTNRDLDETLRKIFAISNAEQRIDDGKKMARTAYVGAGLRDPFYQTLNDLNWCRKIRNHYAHSQWDYDDMRLYAADFEQLAKGNMTIQTIGDVLDHKKVVPLSLLEQQESFFVYVRRCFWYLGEAYRRWDYERRKGHAMRGNPIFPFPVVVARPPIS